MVFFKKAVKNGTEIGIFVDDSKDYDSVLKVIIPVSILRTGIGIVKKVDRGMEKIVVNFDIEGVGSYIVVNVLYVVLKVVLIKILGIDKVVVKLENF